MLIWYQQYDCWYRTQTALPATMRFCLSPPSPLGHRSSSSVPPPPPPPPQYLFTENMFLPLHRNKEGMEYFSPIVLSSLEFHRSILVINYHLLHRLNQLKTSGEEEWKKRVGRKEEILATPEVIKLREKPGLSDHRPTSIADRLNELETSKTTWKERVEESDAKQFTVAARLARMCFMFCFIFILILSFINSTACGISYCLCIPCNTLCVTTSCICGLSIVKKTV